ncbi:MAG TPA: hypothetical protein DGG95_12335 [Cytophagales bacterium]|jgi:hypothetical protein|nr:hypothetical protein [Cytophagales bacterium]
MPRTLQNNRPEGDWDFFHENGLPERSLKINNGDTLLTRLIDSDGKILIADGKGTFHGQVAYEEGVIAKGKIANGKPDGIWNSNYLNEIFCTEKFSHGKFVKGFLPNAELTNKTYRNRSQLNNFIYCDYFSLLEKYKVEKCNDSAIQVYLDHSKFRQYLKNQIMFTNHRLGKRLDLTVTEYKISIQLETNKDGKPVDFRPVTPFSNNTYYSGITRAIASLVTATPLSKSYFHIKIRLRENSS